MNKRTTGRNLCLGTSVCVLWAIEECLFQVVGGKTLSKKKPQQKTIFTSDRSMPCRLLSATDHNIKELKNEVAVLRNKLQAFTEENKFLKLLQTQHLNAISKYENAEINLPDLLATQSKEVLTLRSLLRTSEEKEHRVSKKLREVEADLLKTTDALRALQKLSQDKTLGDREKLEHKLNTYTEKLEANEKKIQDLEKQLTLNITSFNDQLAVAKKKTNEARSITANLQLGIESLKLKLKEREQELCITNIYAHRKGRRQSEQVDSSFSPKVVKVSKAVQVSSLKPRTLQQIKPEGSPLTFHEELKVNLDPETGVHLPEKLLGENISYGTFMGLQSEEMGSRREKTTPCENRERQKSRREREGLDLFKEEMNILKVEPSFSPVNNVMPKVNHLEDMAMEKQENEDNGAKEAVCDKVITPIPRHRPTTFKRHYVFTEATENLHQGYPSTGPLVKPMMPCSGRKRNQQQDELTHFLQDPVTNYEPSFLKFPNERPKDHPSTPGEGTPAKIPPEKKRLLLERLFGPNRILNS